MQPDLFTWSPPACRVIVFPMDRRVGRAREVAAKMLERSTDRAAATYRDQVSDGLRRAMDRLAIPKADQDEQLRGFWQSVQCLMIEMTYRGRRPGGDTA